MADGGEAEGAIDELRSGIVNERSFGTAAPTSSTPGSFYYRIGAATDAVKVYVKIDGTWYGA